MAANNISDQDLLNITIYQFRDLQGVHHLWRCSKMKNYSTVSYDDEPEKIITNPNSKELIFKYKPSKHLNPMITTIFEYIDLNGNLHKEEIQITEHNQTVSYDNGPRQFRYALQNNFPQNYFPQNRLSLNPSIWRQFMNLFLRK